MKTDKERLDILLEAFDKYANHSAAGNWKNLCDAVKACREPVKPRIIHVETDVDNQLFISSRHYGTPYVLYNYAVCRRLGKYAGVDRGLVKEVMNNTPVGAIEGRTERIMQLIAAAAVEVDDG